ncbi:MAG TPA: PA2779 family protein [Terriglobales bacterium]|nr:PA2779 family protein [Terriglobales bacterium]
MLSFLRQLIRGSIACVLALIFAVPPNLAAEAHIVSSAELQKQMLAASHARQQNTATLEKFLSSAQAEKALNSAHMDASKVTKAVSSLSDAELANLAKRANKAQADFAAGNMNDRDLLIILVAIAALILIIVAVRH